MYSIYWMKPKAQSKKMGANVKGLSGNQDIFGNIFKGTKVTWAQNKYNIIIKQTNFSSI